MRRTLTGAWIETFFRRSALPGSLVAPSRVRGLKRIGPIFSGLAVGRTLTGAWIETSAPTGAMFMPESRTLTGAWIETSSLILVSCWATVAPSRVRGLKQS